MIQKWDATETGPLLELWLESTIYAHPLLPKATGGRVWKSCVMSISPPPPLGCGRRMTR